MEVKDELGDALFSWKSKVKTKQGCKGNEDTHLCKNSYLNALQQRDHTGDNPNVYQVMNGLTKQGPSTDWNIIQLQKGEKR